MYEIEGVIETNICLLPMVSEFSWHMIKLHGHYKNHVLPFSGGLLDQPNIYIEAMALINQYLGGK